MMSGDGDALKGAESQYESDQPAPNFEELQARYKKIRNDPNASKLERELADDCFVLFKVRIALLDQLAQAQAQERRLREELTSLIDASLVDHHIATRGPRIGQTVHSDCLLCEWLNSHPLAAQSEGSDA